MTKNGSDIRFEADIDELLGQIVEEFTDKLSRGETIDIGAYEQEFPNHIEEIKSLLPTLKTMVRLGRFARLGQNRFREYRIRVIARKTTWRFHHL